MKVAPESRFGVLRDLREINVEWTSEPQSEMDDPQSSGDGLLPL